MRRKGYYIPYQGAKMYFKGSFTSPERIKAYFTGIVLEQDASSPHCYHAEKDIDENTILIDAGGAEGFFSLDYVKIAKKVIIIKCDQEWVKALKQTFKSYADKVSIINKFLSDQVDEDNVTIDYLVKSLNLTDKNIFIKMDLEGGEYSALCGAKECLEKRIKMNMAVTVYHNMGDEKRNRDFMKNYQYKLQCSNGYMFFAPQSLKFEKPYLTHGVLKIEMSQIK